MSQVIAVIGHGRSPEGQGWAGRIDACDTVVRMWDWSWMPPADYGTKYDYGLFEIEHAMARRFKLHNQREPSKGWIGSLLRATRETLPPNTEVVDQVKWTVIGKSMGGLGATGRLELTRGTIATCWAIEHAKAGDEIILVGFDNYAAGQHLPLEQAFCPAYRANPGTFPFNGYKSGVRRYGNHDLGIERVLVDKLAGQRGVRVRLAQEVWPTNPRAEKNEIVADRVHVSGVALILGDADCVFEDAERALHLFKPGAIVATSNIGKDWETDVDVWCTLHPEKAKGWVGMVNAIKARTEAGRNRPETWGHRKAAGIDRVCADWAGGSGLFTTRVALIEKGFSRVVLAGVPMTRTPHYNDKEPWREAERYHKGWIKRFQEISNRVRSMSGWTEEMFGGPSVEWLKGEATTDVPTTLHAVA